MLINLLHAQHHVVHAAHEEVHVRVNSTRSDLHIDARVNGMQIRFDDLEDVPRRVGLLLNVRNVLRAEHAVEVGVVSGGT